MANDRISKALELFQRFPENDLSRYNLAQACFDAGDYAQAVPHLRELCAKKNDWMVVHILLGKCLLQTGYVAEAKDTFGRALRLAIEQHHDGPREELEELLRAL
jgi:Flp pilus assembly protein TadD